MLIRYLTAILTLACTATAFAQNYTPVVVTGFNSDLFAETAPNSLSTTSMSTDLSNHVMYTTTFAAGAGLPAGVVNTGTVVSGTRTYQLAPFNQQNALYVDVGAIQSVTLFTTGTYSKISLMGFSAEGNSTLNIKLNFTDGTTSNYGNHTLSDWFNGANAVYCCFSRCIRTAAAPYNIDGLPSNPRFYPIDISLTCDDQKKNLQTIIIENLNGTTGFTNAFVLAVSGVTFTESIFSFATPVTCPGGSNGSIFLFASGTAAPFTYSWNTLPVQTTANATNLMAGTYICEITDVNGCITYDTVTVSELPSLPIDAQAFPAVICAGETAQLLISGLTNFIWQPGGQTNSPAPATPLTTTTYTVSGTDGSGCARQDTVTVTVNALPVISINPDPAAVCAGDSLQLQASGAIVYNWLPITGLSNANTSNPKASPAVTTVYTVTGIAANNCSNSSTVEVTVAAGPAVAAIAIPPVICEGDTATLSASGLVAFTWSPGGQTASTFDVTPVVTTAYTVSGTGVNGCPGQATVTVTVNPLPQIIVTPAAVSICNGDSVPLLATGGNSYSWSPAGGLSNATNANPVAFPVISTIYTVSGTNADGCSATAIAAVDVYPSPVIAITASPPGICQGDTATLAVSGLTVFTWLPGGQNYNPIEVTPANTSTYTVTGTDLNGCNGSGTVEVIVEPIPMVFATAADTLICSGSNLVLNANGNAAQYIWSPGNGTGNTYHVAPTDTVEYILTGILGNCLATDTLQINVIPAPFVTFSASPPEGCAPLLVNFSAVSSNPVSWSWSFGDGSNADVSDPLHMYETGIWSVALTVTDTMGCSTTFLQPELVTAYEAPVADFTVDPLLNIPVELVNASFQFSNLSTGAISYVWDFDDGTFSSEEDPLHAYKTPGEYIVTLAAKGPGNCSDSVSKEFLHVIPATTGFLPNAFTPNGDGLNDVFIPANPNLISYNMKIFNRWGKLVFNSAGQMTGWDGSHEGVPSETGVYIYTIWLEFENGDMEIHKGNVTLLR